MDVVIRSTRRRTHTVWFTVLATIATLWLWSSTATAGTSKVWTIADMSGRVNIVRSGAAPVALTTGDELRPGDMIETAADSSATLVRDGESIIIAPNSRMGLPASNDSKFATLVLQKLGTLLFKVEKQQQQHFEVKTPYLAAVVKGTTFAVNVSPAGSSVHVIEGAVQVGDLTGKVALVRPGQTALVSSAPGATLSIKGDSPKAPAQRSDATPDQDTGTPGEPAASPKAADAASIDAPLTASKASPEGFEIKDTVGPADIDIATATNGLIQSAQAPGRAGAAYPGQGASPTGVSNSAAAVETSGGGNGTAGLAWATGNPGGAPLAGNPHGGPVAAGLTGSLPATASLVAQVTASPGSQSRKDKKQK